MANGVRIFQRDNPARQVQRMATQPIDKPRATKVQIGTRIGFIKQPVMPKIKPHPNWIK